METNDVLARHFMHSCHVKTRTGDAVLVKEKLLLKDGSTKPSYIVFKNPKRSFYITKKRYQNYRFKPEREPFDRLDKFTCHEYEKRQRLASIFDIRSNWPKNSQLYRSPYIYGADISIEALMKMKYMDNLNNTSVAPSYGFLDIETDIPTQEVILISYVSQGKAFCAIREPWMYKIDDKGNRIKVGLEEITQYVKESLSEHIEEHNYEIILSIQPTEIDCIIWMFRQIHKLQTDFIGIWNMDFDIPKIMTAIDKRSKYHPRDIMCDPKLDQELKYINYRQDRNKKAAHFTLKWHWLYSACTSQFVDSMGLFSQCRRTAGFRGSYTLDSVLHDFLGLRKLDIHGEASHPVMQKKYFREYVAYNIFDSMSMDILERKNNDIAAMHVLAGATPVSSFSRATAKATNETYHYWINRGYVLSACSNEEAYNKLSKLFPSNGGTVLPPGLVSNVGMFVS